MTCATVFAVNRDTRLTAIEKVVFTNIAGGYRKRAEIATASGCAESSVPRAVRKLESFGYLKREFKDGKPNEYVILDQADTGIPQDTGIATRGARKRRGISTDTGVHPPTDTGGGGSTDTGQSDARIDYARAPAETPITNTTLSEIHPERAEPSGERGAHAPDAGKVTRTLRMSDRMRDIAADAGLLNGTGEATFMRWRAYYAAKGAVFADFDAAFEKWVLEDLRRDNKTGNTGTIHDEPARAPRMEIRRGKVSATSAFLLGGQSGDDSAIDLGRLDSQRID